MKPTFLSNLATRAQSHRIIATIAAIAFIGAICAGGWFGWQEYEKRQTAAFAVEKIKKALTPPDPEALAHMVDFKAMTRELAHLAAQAFPFFLAGPDQERQISRHLQTQLLERLTQKDEKGSQFPDDASERAKLERPLELLPPDFLAQLVQHMQARQTGPDTAIVTASITHPQLNETFPISMDMEKTPDGWRIRHLTNAKSLIDALRQAMLKRFAALRQVVEKKNTDTTRQMNEMLPIQSCTADAGVLSNGRTVLVVIHVLAHNRGDIQINNFNLDTTLTNLAGHPLAQRFLNAARPVAPGKDFDQRWTMELDASDPLAQTLLTQSPLRCMASWKTLSLAKPKVLHIEEVPNADIKCGIKDHNHPAGFCELPIFKR